MREFIAFLKLIRSQLITYCVAAVALLVGSVTVLVVPPYIGRVVNSFHILETGNAAPAAQKALYIVVALILLDAVATVVYAFLVALASERIINALRARFFTNLLTQRLDERSPKRLGEIASEFASDLALVQDGLSGSSLNFVRYALCALGSICALLYIDLKLTALAFVGVAAFGSLILLLIKKANTAILSIQRYRARVVGLLLEGATNVSIIQAYGRIEYLSKRFAEALSETFKRVRVFLLFMACISPVSLLLFATVMSAVAIFGMQELRADNMTVKELVAYFSYAIILVMSGSQVGYLAGRLRQASAMLAKHHDMLIDPPAAERADGPGERQRISAGKPFGFIVQNATFTYPGKPSPALHNISLTLLAGGTNAIVGESGAGKSTLAALLCGLYRPQSGSVRLMTKHGAPLDVMPGEVRQEIALVPQEPFLFAATIAENISFGREWITDSEVRQAAMRARIHDFVMGLPDGYQSVLQEGGKDLSRGQRQRISIARALAGKPSIIILDEATASLDTVSEQGIKAFINDLRGDVTFVIIAHQGALLADVDRLVVLHGGAVIFEGHPQEVRQNSGSETLLSCVPESLVPRSALDRSKVRL